MQSPHGSHGAQPAALFMESPPRDKSGHRVLGVRRFSTTDMSPLPPKTAQSVQNPAWGAKRHSLGAPSSALTQPPFPHGTTSPDSHHTPIHDPKHTPSPDSGKGSRDANKDSHRRRMPRRASAGGIAPVEEHGWRDMNPPAAAAGAGAGGLGSEQPERVRKQLESLRASGRLPVQGSEHDRQVKQVSPTEEALGPLAHPEHTLDPKNVSKIKFTHKRRQFTDDKSHLRVPRAGIPGLQEEDGTTHVEGLMRAPSGTWGRGDSTSGSVRLVPLPQNQTAALSQEATAFPQWTLGSSTQPLPRLSAGNAAGLIRQASMRSKGDSTDGASPLMQQNEPMPGMASGTPTGTPTGTPMGAWEAPAALHDYQEAPGGRGGA